MSLRPNFGGLASERDALDAVIARVTAAVDPQEIYLFGSRARNAARPDSDFDLLIVGRPGGLGSDDYEVVDKAINGLGIGCDLVPCSAKDFESAAVAPTSLVARVLAEGRRVYAAP